MSYSDYSDIFFGEAPIIIILKTQYDYKSEIDWQITHTMIFLFSY